MNNKSRMHCSPLWNHVSRCVCIILSQKSNMYSPGSCFLSILPEENNEGLCSHCYDYVKVVVLWDVTSHSLVDINQRFGGKFIS
jgi:hypothetical protein